MLLDTFNVLDRERAVELLRPCVAIDRWVDAVVDSRPYSALTDILETARAAAQPWTTEEIDGALSHHPRIGERAHGTSREAAHSRAEQTAIDPTDASVASALADGNAAYEDRFDRVFLVRAAGRTPAEILETLNARLLNSDATEMSIVREQLLQIALLRLEGQFPS